MKYAVLGFTVATVAWLTSPASGPPQDQARWSWRGHVTAGRTLEIRGVNGTILAERAQGGEVEVQADRHGRRDDPEEVRLEVIEHDGGVTICAVYPGRRNRCAPGGGSNSVQHNDVQVDFTVRVPAGVRFEGHTVNGDVEALNLDGPAEVATVNGDARVETASGEASARTVNGSVTARVSGTDGRAPLRFETVNGGITVSLPNGLNADLEAETVNGGITTDFPVQVTGRLTRRMNGQIGQGGRTLRLATVNGPIRLRRLP
jgi:carbon monoxide dehydrogenase subunit G